jgi:gluconolactonase
MLRFDECNGQGAVFRQPCNNANGNTVDHEGRLITCEHLTRRVTRTEHDGSITALSDSYNGKRLNSPNDVVVNSDGSIWFTDPGYGILFDYEGKRAASEIGRCNVYRIDPAMGTTSLVADDFEKPNGLAFSPDESVLYVADTGLTNMPGGPKHIRRLALKGTSAESSQISAECTTGLFDGFRVDADGRVWAREQRAGPFCLDSFPGFLGEASAVGHAAAGSCCGVK